jgi:hypothetical protein
MKISVPEATVGTAAVQEVGVGQVRLGPVRVGRLTLNGVGLQASTGVAQLRNVRVALKLVFALDWTVGVVIDAGIFGKIDFTQSGVLDLGALDLGLGFGDLTLPGLADLKLDIPSLPMTDVSAVIGALKNLDLGPVLAERIRARGLVVPGQGFRLDGLGLGGATLQGLSMPDAAIDEVTIHRVSGGTLPLAGLTLPDLAFPQVKVPRMSCRKVSADSNADVTTLPEADVGLLKAALTVTTTAHFEIDELRIDGVQAAASIGEIALEDVEIPFEVLDVTLSQIGIERLAVPNVKVK